MYLEVLPWKRAGICEISTLPGWKPSPGARRAPRRRTAFSPARARRGALRAALAGLSAGRDEGEAAEWLADNRYLIEREALGAARDFSGAGRLRAGREGALICEAAAALVSAPLRPRGRARGGGVFRGLRPRDAPHTRGARPHRRGDTVRADAIYRAGIRRRAARGGRRRRNREPARALRRRPHGARRGLRPLRADPRARPRGRIRLHGRGQPRAIPPPPRVSREARWHIRERLRAARPRARGGHAGDPKRSHVGWWILAEPLGRPRRERTGALCALAALMAAALVSAAAGLVSGGLFTALLALLPALEIAKNGLDALLLRLIEPRVLPRLALEDGIPDEGRTVCAVSAVLASEKDGPALARRLETFRAASRGCGDNLLFALLADLPEAAVERAWGDAAVNRVRARGRGRPERKVLRRLLSPYPPPPGEQARRRLAAARAQARGAHGPRGADDGRGERARVPLRRRPPPARREIHPRPRRGHDAPARRGAGAHRRDAPPAQPAGIRREGAA